MENWSKLKLGQKAPWNVNFKPVQFPDLIHYTNICVYSGFLPEVGPGTRACEVALPPPPARMGFATSQIGQWCAAAARPCRTGITSSNYPSDHSEG